jgi:F0F1-type ATP synthase assembly protein I
MGFVDPKTMQYASRLTSVVLAKMIFVYGGYRAGVWADEHWGTTPLFMALGLFVTFGLGLVFLLRVLERGR